MTDRHPHPTALDHSGAAAPDAEAAKVWAMLQRIDVCMFTTRCADTEAPAGRSTGEALAKGIGLATGHEPNPGSNPGSGAMAGSETKAGLAAGPVAGTLRARPMSTIPTPEEGAIYLLTEATSTAALDVAGSGAVLLSYQGGGDHVALAGTASVSTDTALVRRLWSPGAEVFWPDGPVTHDVVALIIKPQRADYWDGPNPAEGAAKFLFGFLTGRQPDMGERGAVSLTP